MLPAADVSRCLADMQVGVVNYFHGYLGKSTIFASYCAHRLLPLFALPNDSEIDGLHAARHYLVASEIPGPVKVQNMQDIADQAHRWYSQHTLIQTAASLAADLHSASTA